MLRRITSARKCREHVGGQRVGCTRRFDLDGVVAKIRQFELFSQQSAVGVRIGGDAARPGRCKILQFCYEPSVGVE